MGSGILGTKATLFADINLILQVILLAMLVFAAWEARRGKVGRHHGIMTAAVVINAAAIVAVMNPAFFRVLPFAVRNPGAPGPTVMWPHVALGAVAELLGAYVVIRLRLDPMRVSRLGTLKSVMIATFALWTAALLMGIAVYYVWHVR